MKHLRIWLACFAVVVSCFLHPLHPVDAGPIQVVDGHPRILVTPEKLPALQERARTTHADTYEVLKDWCDQNWTNAGDRRKVFTTGDRDYEAGVLRYALIYLLGEIPGHSYAHPIQAYGDKTVETLLDIVAAGDRHNLEYAAIAYDWVNDRISTADKTTIVEWFKSVAGERPSLRDRVGYRFAATPYCLYPGLAFYGDGIDDALAQRYIDFIPTWLDDARCTSHESGHDGGHAAGMGYGKYVYGTYYHQGMDFYALVTATDLTVEETFDKYPYMKGFATWLLYGIQPGGKAEAPGSSQDVATVTKWEDCGSWLWNVSSRDHALMQTLRLLVEVAKESGDLARARWLTWLINVRFQAPRQETTWDILFNDRAIQPADPGALGIPPVKAFGWDEATGTIDQYMENPKAGLGQVYMKSSWDAGRNTTHACFKAFPYYYFGHQHFDSLAFSIFKGEPLALPNSGAYFYWYEGSMPDYGPMQGYPHHWYYYTRTVAANSLLVMDPNEVIRMREAYYKSDPYFKDGGQRCLNDPGGRWGSVVPGPPSAEEIRKSGGGRDWGGLVRFEDGEWYTYASGDATKGYNSIVDGARYVCRGATDGTEANPKVSLVQRDFVYLKSPGGTGEYFVVFDRVESTDPTFRKVFLLHTVGEPLLSGSERRIYGGPKGGLFVSDDTKAMRIVQDQAQLFVSTLLPTAARVYKMGGYAESVTTSDIDAAQGSEVGGPKIDLPVADPGVFADVPVVTVDNGSYVEAFSCEGKDEERNLLTGCIRGKRYYKHNEPQFHPRGSRVRQDYAWMVREVDTGNWISYPHDYGTPNKDSNKLNDADDYGRWAVWIETTQDEVLSNLLHVLQPTTDKGQERMAPTSLVPAGTNRVGCLIDDRDNRWVLMFPRDDTLTREAVYRVTVTGRCRHLITGLESGVYDVYKDGQKVLTKASSRQNVLYFETDGGETFQIVRTGDVPNIPPSATIAADPMRGEIPLTVRFTGSGSDEDGKVVSYGWDFGDGAASSAQSPTHTYRTPGDFLVRLTVHDEDGAAGSASLTIHAGSSANQAPSASVTASPTSGNAPLLVRFSGSGTDPDGRITSYAWDFGDGARSTEQNPVHTYQVPGTYRARLTVTDEQGATGSATIGIVVSGQGGENEPPTASLRSEPAFGEAPLEVRFSCSASDRDGRVVSYSWDFGDGTTSTEQNPTHTYERVGDYAVRVVISDDQGARAGASTVVRVAGPGGQGNLPPSVVAGADVTSGPPPLRVHFTGSGSDGDGRVVSYLWNFGDGTTSTEQNPTHTFQEPGTYTVSVSVTDDQGAMGSASLGVLVSGTSSFPYVINDLTFYPVPDLPRPEKGVPFEDPVFHTKVTRITDSATEAHGSAFDYAQPGYPKHDIENADGTMLIIQSYSGTGWHVWNAHPPYNKIKDVPSSILNPRDPEVRWDNTDPRLLYAHKGSRLYCWNVETGETRLLHDFNEDFPGETITEISMGEEGDASDDRRYWAFFTRSEGVEHQTHLVVYDKEEDRVVSRLDWGEGAFVSGRTYLEEGVWLRSRSSGSPLDYNSVGMSPSGQYVVAGFPPTWIYPRDLSSTRIVDTHGHVDCAIDDEGREVVFWVGRYYGPAGGQDHGYWAVMADLQTGEVTYLAPFGDVQLYHPSGNAHDTPGWAVVSSYNPMNCGTPTIWSDASVLMYELTRRIREPTWGNHARVWRIAHTHMCRERYSDDPFAKINKRGTKIFFGSGWGRSVNDGPYDVYQVDLPRNWYQDLAGNMPPAASVSADPVLGNAPLEVAFQGAGTDRDGTVVSYEWDFGDGARSSGRTVTHTYQRPGQYTATLTVTDDQGAVGRAGIRIAVAQAGGAQAGPVAFLSVAPLRGPAPLRVAFAGAGVDPDGSRLSYGWDFGDGSSAGEQNPVHVYDRPGTYTARLTVTGSQGSTGSAWIDVVVEGTGPVPRPARSPTAALSATPTSGEAPMTVSFEGTGTDPDGRVVQYIWYFGDGYSPETVNEATRVHAYQDPGDYVATLTAVDDAGLMGSASLRISVTAPGMSPPVIQAASGSPSRGPVPLTVRFRCTASDEDGIAYYFWNFGDGGTATGASSTHTYKAAGHYIATVTVKDGSGARSCARVEIDVGSQEGDHTPPRAPGAPRVRVR